MNMDLHATYTVVMTGATSGLGAHAFERLEAEGARVIVGARSVSADGVLRLDLSSLASVDAFANAVLAITTECGIDALVLNAGIQFADTDHRTEDGFEETFAVNHLAHAQLVRRLLPRLNDGARLILTTSDTHDPALYPIGPLELDIDGWADGSADINGLQAYAASKLANLVTAMHLAAESDLHTRDIRVLAYNPALTGGTELQRAQPELRARIAGMSEQPAGDGPYVGTPERSGEVLAGLVTGSVAVPKDAVYVSLLRGEVTFPQPSQLARREGVAAQLWEQTEGLLARS